MEKFRTLPKQRAIASDLQRVLAFQSHDNTKEDPRLKNAIKPKKR